MLALPEDTLIYAAAPAETDGCREFSDAFVRRFTSDPRQFEVYRDGIGIIQQMRRHHPRKYELAEHSAVGRRRWNRFCCPEMARVSRAAKYQYPRRLPQGAQARVW